jgi:hypothetical protein
MLRTVSTSIAAGLLVLTLAACSAGSGGQSGCAQPPIASYATPTLVNPADGATGVSTKLGTIVISAQQATLPGTITLSSSGASVTIGTPVAAQHQPSGAATIFNIPVGGLSAGKTYTMGWTITYPGGCLGPAVVKSSTWGSFST